MEYIDVLTQTGEPTDIVKTREEVHQRGDWHRTVHICIVNQAREILLQKRAKSKESHPGMWDIACAGHISAGQTSIEAALLELHEELGIHVDQKHLTFLFTHPSSHTLQNGRYIDNELHDLYLLTTRLAATEFFLQESEVDAVAYVTVESFYQRVAGGDPSIVPHRDEFLKLISVLQQI